MSAVKGGPSSHSWKPTLKVALGHSPTQVGPGVMQLHSVPVLFSASGPPDSKPVVIYLLPLSCQYVSSFSCFTEFSALAAAAPHAGWPGLPQARCRAAGNGVKTVTQEYRPSTGPSGSRTRRRGPSAGLERGQCAQPHQVWHIVGDIEGFGFDLLISRC